MQKNNLLKKITGVVVPLGALYTKENQIIGEYPDLIPFSNFCKKAGFKIIQLLPVNDSGTQSSPYSALSAFALHPIYIRIKNIDGFSDIYNSNQQFKKCYDDFINNTPYTLRYDYDSILNTKIYLLQLLFNSLKITENKNDLKELSSWIQKNLWVKEYAVYKNLKWKYMQAGWKEWADDDKQISAEKIDLLWQDKKYTKDLLFYAWCQMIASTQFEQATEQIHKDGILLKGDIPILMNEDSCDIWAHPDFFNQKLYAGSPSDGDNPAGQNWGFPIYNWKNIKKDDYSWWKNRLSTASNFYDAYRLDHILGFFRIWAIPSEDCNALNGHTEPFSYFSRKDLYKLGFDDDRIRWLSQPHIPTNVIEDITWNREIAHQILEKLCTQIGDEELWLFKKTVTGSRQILETDFSEMVDGAATERITAKLVEYWSNRTLIEISKDKFIPLWSYDYSTSWNSLNENEKKSLLELFATLNKKNERLWKKQADEIFESITKNIKMIPCGEDLGVNISCVPQTMKNHNILGLRVVRWCRKWDIKNQPYIPFDDYEPLSVTTTSVHDSSTIRDWYENGTTDAFFSEEESEKDDKNLNKSAQKEFSPDIAFDIMNKCAKSASIWYISPLQDFLYLNKKYWLENSKAERINIPGTVTKFNWTYRLPASIEELSTDNELIEKINLIARR